MNITAVKKQQRISNFLDINVLAKRALGVLVSLEVFFGCFLMKKRGSSIFQSKRASGRNREG